MKIIIDAKDGAMGRVASFAAKQALLGKEVAVLNCNEAVISGNKTDILAGYKQARSRGGSALKGPNFPREPFRIMKRTIRGMLYYKDGRGRDAFKKIKCYNNIPLEFANAKMTSLAREMQIKVIKLKELSRIL